MPQIEVVVGVVGRAHGLSGEVFVDLRTDSPKVRFRRGATVWADGRPLTVGRCRMQGVRAVVGFDEVGDRTAAETLTGLELVSRVDVGELPEEDDSYYDHQLIGLAVLTTDGALVGSVVRVDHLGFQDLLAVSTDKGERLVPFVNDLVPEVDLAAGRLVVNAIPGLLEETPDDGSVKRHGAPQEQHPC